MRVLCRALQACDGEPSLAKALAVAPAALSGWLAGEAIPPEIFFKALALTTGKARR